MKKYSMLMPQIGCAAIGVLAFTIFGPGWLAKIASVVACVAYMIYTDSVHPQVFLLPRHLILKLVFISNIVIKPTNFAISTAVSMPLLFIDGVKLQHLIFWYVLYPEVAGCILLCFIVINDMFGIF
ncbi:uncharacterized protein LOC131630429 [Vicia villosa]|uniref:uncharacterized protein LOC131630429 n=1 Tax=Vicia villosa TaxID=3911 RepID=UPI00273B73CF|nr:uncharacterized protein LOC131630429 [Vicia villosa]